MSIKEEFDMAFENEWSTQWNGREKSSAIWAAKWMAERCAQSCERINAHDISPDEPAGICRELSKELGS